MVIEHDLMVFGFHALKFKNSLFIWLGICHYFYFPKFNRQYEVDYLKWSQKYIWLHFGIHKLTQCKIQNFEFLFSIPMNIYIIIVRFQ